MTVNEDSVKREMKITPVDFYSAPVGVRRIAINPFVSASVCLSVCPREYLKPIDRPSRNFVCGSPVHVARSSFGGVALCYVLPVLWMTSRLALIDGRPARVGSTHRRRSITRATGAESDVYECLFLPIFHCVQDGLGLVVTC